MLDLVAEDLRVLNGLRSRNAIRDRDLPALFALLPVPSRADPEARYAALQRLIEAGHVIQSTEHRTTRGRPRTLYSAATGSREASSPIARRKVRDAAVRGDVMRRVMPWTGSNARTGLRQRVMTRVRPACSIWKMHAVAWSPRRAP